MKLKDFPGLGMNINSDQFLLPEGYTAIEQPYYRGNGMLSVNELQDLCLKYEQYCHQQAVIKKRLINEIRYGGKVIEKQGY